MIIIQHMIILQREKNLKMFVVFPTEKVVVNGYLIRFVLTFSSPLLCVSFDSLSLYICFILFFFRPSAAVLQQFRNISLPLIAYSVSVMGWLASFRARTLNIPREMCEYLVE